MPPSEFELIARYFSSLDEAPGVLLGVGDDCAILAPGPERQLASSIDTLVAGTHFPDNAAPADIGYRAVVVAASDLAAMGAEPLAMSLALTLPAADESWLQAFSSGLAEASRDCRLPLAGGDTTRGPLTVTVQVLGTLPAGQSLRRRGARPGDRLCVSGTLGDGAAALALFRNEWQPPAEQADYLRQRFYRPRPRLALGRSLLGQASSAIDLSDGLLADAGHLAAASGVALVIDPQRLPLSPALAAHPDRHLVLRWALAGGDDYQLCFTLPEGVTLPAECTVIGETAAGQGVSCGMPIDFAPGYQHF